MVPTRGKKKALCMKTGTCCVGVRWGEKRGEGDALFLSNGSIMVAFVIEEEHDEW